MSMVPDLEIVRHFQNLHPCLKALGFAAVFGLAAVFLVPLIGSQGISSYWIALVAMAVISAILIFATPTQTEIRSKPEVESKKATESRMLTRQYSPSEMHRTSVQQKPAREEVLKRLTHDEKKFLAPYIFQDVTSQNVDVMGGVYQSLYKKQVLDPPPSVGYLTRRDVLIQDWAKEYLKANPDLLKGYEKVPPREVSWWLH